MTDDKPISNDYKNIIKKTNKMNNALENISNFAVMNSASNLSNTLANISNAIPHESLRIVENSATASVVSRLSKPLAIDSLTNDLLLLKNMEILGKTMKDASNSIATNNIRMTGETLANLSHSIAINSLPIDSLFLSESMRELGKTIKDASDSMAIDDMRRIKKTLTNLSDSTAINSLIFENIQQIANTVQEMALSIPNFSELITTIDWDTTDLTEEDVKEAQEILTQEDIYLVISQELNKHEEITQLSNPMLIIIRMFTFLIIFINRVEDANLAIEVVNHAVIPTIETATKSKFPKLQNKITPMKDIINKFHEMLKENLPLYILGPLGIVIKKGLKVHEKKRLDSPIKGSLDALVVVKIIKQDRNWIYISLEDSAGNSILKGWTLTRYIKKIK